MKKWIAMLLVLAMVISLAPAVYAQEHEETPAAAEATTVEAAPKPENTEGEAAELFGDETIPLTEVGSEEAGEAASTDLPLPVGGYVEPETTVIIVEEYDETTESYLAEPELDLSALAEQYESRFFGMLGWTLLDNYSNRDNMRSVYAAMYDGLTRGDEFQTSIRIYDSATHVTIEEAQIVADAMFFDHPELVMFTLSGGFGLQGTEDGQALFYQPSYSDSFADMTEVRDALSDIDAKVDPVVKEIVGRSVSEFELVQGVHDWLCQNVTYDSTLERENTHNMVGAILNRSCVCDGYAHAF